MLWKTNVSCRKIHRKVQIDSLFRRSFLHKRQFSTGVGNFVENDTHGTRFVGIESAEYNAFHRIYDAFHVSKNASCRKPLAILCEMVYHIHTETKITQEGV